VVVGAAAAAGGYLLGSSDDDGDDAAVPETTTRSEAEASMPAGWKLCSNERYGYALGYPSDWHVPALSAESQCTFFDPAPIQLPESSDAFGATLEVAPVQQSYEQLVASLADARFEEVLERRELTISGRRAVKVVSRATGEGLLDRGTESATYVVDHSPEPPLLLRTIKRPNANWEERLRLLDEAARTLILFEPEQAAAEESPPDSVLRKRAAMLAAAETGDYEGLAELTDPTEFEYTFGEPVDGGPAAYWLEAERSGEVPTPADALAMILRMPYTLSRGIYVWPFAYDTTEGELTSYERGLLKPLGRGGAFSDGYLGWRAGIRPDGRWVFFLAGD
jgi:hypothetical protein